MSHPDSPTSLPPRPAPQRLASAKLALLQDVEEARHHADRDHASAGAAAGVAIMSTIREKPLLAMGGAAVLGFFLVRKNFFLKRVMTMLAVRVGMNAIKQIIK